MPGEQPGISFRFKMVIFKYPLVLLAFDDIQIFDKIVVLSNDIQKS